MKLQGYVLVVEDDETFAGLIEEHLHWLGAPVVHAGDAVAAYKKALARPPSLVIMDVNMPGFGNGLDALRSFRGEPSLQNVPVLIVTGLPPDRLRNADLPAERILYKPVDWRNFDKVVKSAVGL